MTTILAIFTFSSILSLLFTPVAGKIGRRFSAIDISTKRKVHSVPTPRTGGLAIFIVFFVTLFATQFLKTNVSNLVLLDRPSAFLMLGGFVCFGIGLVDDFKRQHPGIKLLFQIIAASLAYGGGVSFGGIIAFGMYLKFGVFSYLITVLWFLLFINAINLVDGLDGLAAGLVFFVCVVMTMLSILREDYLTGIYFACLGGSVFGFLRYNFNPATIFLGDGGSYFLGFAVAGLSILGSVKSQVGAALLIPMIALGVPLFDTILAPLRRFVRGKKMFRPDNGHIHHKLLSMGLTAKKAVWLIYTVTFVLCVFALILVNILDERAGLFLVLLGAVAIIFIRKLGYFEYFATEKIYGWFKDLTDEAGLSHERKTFLSTQIDISKATNTDILWREVSVDLETLNIDRAAFYEAEDDSSCHTNEEMEESNSIVLASSVCMRRKTPQWEWENNQEAKNIRHDSHKLMKIELPLINDKEIYYGSLMVIKDVRIDPVSHYTLRRVEHLRRTIIGTMDKLQKQ